MTCLTNKYMKIAVCPGSFDPITNGHLDLIIRASKMFDKVIVAVLKNSEKKYMFTTTERTNLVKSACEHIENVEVCAFDGLMIDFAKRNGACAIVKGARNSTDYEYEQNMFYINKQLCEDIDTILIPARATNQHISSSIVKELYKYGADFSDLVPPCVYNMLNKNEINI